MQMLKKTKIHKYTSLQSIQQTQIFHMDYIFLQKQKQISQ